MRECWIEQGANNCFLRVDVPSERVAERATAARRGNECEEGAAVANLYREKAFPKSALA